MAKKKRKKQKAALNKRLFYLFLVLVLLFCLVSFFVAYKQFAYKQTQFAATGAFSADISAHNIITASLGLSFLLLILATLIFGIATYLIIQINKNNHVEFMVKQTIIDLFYQFGSFFKPK